ncbi:hypothetical protein [uncultured Thiocystis sp.]|uniref:hypothetical protein n=1 Tax=uncultured Thiocystis sp. TaxID=1202134 RepID=UPI0025FE880E|nr:hypothetical protein [uncultured Thiocystis sp.]
MSAKPVHPRASMTDYRLLPMGDGKYAVVTSDGTWICVTTANHSALERITKRISHVFTALWRVLVSHANQPAVSSDPTGGASWNSSPRSSASI